KQLRRSEIPRGREFSRSLLGNVTVPTRFNLGAQAGDRPVAPSATGSSSKGVTTRNAVSLLTGAGPGATLAFSASTPPAANSLRQKRTLSSLTPNASAICGLQPASGARHAPGRLHRDRASRPVPQGQRVVHRLL